jgi:hypothetical protein
MMGNWDEQRKGDGMLLCSVHNDGNANANDEVLMGRNFLFCCFLLNMEKKLVMYAKLFLG